MAIFENIGNTIENSARDIYEDIFRVRPEKIVPHIQAPKDSGLPYMVEQGYNNMLKNAGKSLWQGMMQAAGSGFGKGVLVAAGVLVLGSALALGLMAASGMLTVAGAPVLFSTAFFNGAGMGLTNMVSAGGLAILGLGGAIGGIQGVRKEQANISAEVAKTQAADYELMRRVQQSQTVQPTINQAPDVSFRDREAQRRAEAAVNNNLGLH